MEGSPPHPRPIQDRSIAAVVVSHGHEVEVPRVVEDLRRHEQGVVHEIVIVDNLAAGHLRERYRDDDSVTVLEPQERGGFGRNVNLGVASVSGDPEVVCLVNPDVRLEEAVVAELARTLRQRKWGIIAPVLLDAESGQPDVNARAYPSMRRLGVRTLRRMLGRPVPREGFPDPSEAVEVEVDWLSGAFMVVETSWFRSLGGFDEDFYMYGEDVDLCLRSRARGRPVGVSGRVRALHVGARRSATDTRHLRWHLSSLARLYRKHGVSGPRREPDGPTS